jgi:HEAT repeat protein
MAAQEIDALFAQTLTGDYDDDAPWTAIHALRRIGTREVFEKAAEWCESTNPLIRARGVDVLAQLGRTADHHSNNFPEESYSVITRLLQGETEARPLAAAIGALGHLENPLAVPLIANFHSHPSSEVRFDVAFALGCFPNEALSVATLLHLMQDTDEDVRDWATFGLGVLGNSESAEIRDALVRGLNDSDEDVQEEAMVGLGKRKDRRVLSVLLPALEQPTMTVRVIEAAYMMLDMQNEREGWKGDDYAAALRERFSL